MKWRIGRLGILASSFLLVVVACSSGEIAAETTTTTSLAPSAAVEAPPTSVAETGSGLADFEGDVSGPDFGVSTDLSGC